MSEKIKVTSIEIKINNKEIKFTIEEAKELCSQLNELFKKEVISIPYAPIVIERNIYPNPWIPYNPIWYSNGDNTRVTMDCNTLQISYCGNQI